MAAKPLPPAVRDRQRGRRVSELMDDRAATYENRPRRSLKQWPESEPLYDWLLAS
jgi:hypothetical protein